MANHSELDNLDEDGYTRLQFSSRVPTRRTASSEKAPSGLCGSSPSWRSIAVHLGILCLIALVVAVVLGTKSIWRTNPRNNALKNDSFPSGNEQNGGQPTKSSLEGVLSTTCPPNWILFENSCYLFSTSLNSWTRSKSRCFQLGSSLLKIDSLKELDFIENQVSSNPYNSFWIGLSRPSAEGPWLWEDGSEFSSNLFQIRSTGILMQAKYNSTRNMLDDDWDTTVSLHSRVSTISRRPERGHTEHPPPSSAWRPVALTLLILFLVLLIGLAIMGFMFFQFYQLSKTQKDSINKIEERSSNLSQQLQSLQAQNRKLAETLQRVAEKYCRELYNKTGEHRCSPCSEKWRWHGNKCYQFYKESKSWQDCDYFCIAENSTMLKINTQDVLQFAMPLSYSEFFYSYWIGLSRNGSDKAWLWVDGEPYTSELFKIKTDLTSLNNRDCATILSGTVFSKNCQELRRCACERMATTVQIERLP